MSDSADRAPLLEIRGLSVFAGSRTLLRDVHLQIPTGCALALVGPSGAGKSTLLKCLNRLIDLTDGLQVRGEVLFHGISTRSPGTDVDTLRARIGMLFQQPVVFPTSIRANVLFGVRHLGRTSKKDWPQIVERSLRETSLWDEVKDRLDESALRLSVGQQQRLCLARTLALEPEVILLDEPTSALDVRATEVVEESLLRLKGRRTLVLVTHNPLQAERVADRTVTLAPVA
jgi:phosphate transport system ATP-binding protein